MLSERDKIAITEEHWPNCIFTLHTLCFVLSMCPIIWTPKTLDAERKTLFKKRKDFTTYLALFLHTYVCVLCVYTPIYTHICICTHILYVHTYIERESILEYIDFVNQYKTEYLKTWSTIKSNQLTSFESILSMILPILLIPLHKPINILVNTHWIELLKNAFIFTDIMYSYIKFINSILGNTVITESSERLKGALRPFHIYNNSNISLPTLSLTQNEKINNQKKSDSFIQGHLF